MKYYLTVFSAYCFLFLFFWEDIISWFILILDFLFLQQLCMDLFYFSISSVVHGCFARLLVHWFSLPPMSLLTKLRYFKYIYYCECYIFVLCWGKNEMIFYLLVLFSYRTWNFSLSLFFPFYHPISKSPPLFSFLTHSSASKLLIWNAALSHQI